MKKIVLVPDSFKGTMTSEEICEIMRACILRAFPRADVVSIPMSDGGEGTVDAFLAALGGDRIFVLATNPLGEPIESRYGLLSGGHTAVIETAACAGLPLIENRKDPLRASTYGVGHQLCDALDRGVRKIVLGLGGSATNDGGCGAACALGVKFFDEHGQSFVPVGGTLSKIARIDMSGRHPALKETELTVMCDIDNPLYGPAGAAAVFAPQKGATPDMVELLDGGLRNLSQIILRDLGIDVSLLPGSGAAGGMGAGAAAFLGGVLKSGIDTVLDTVCFEELIRGADMIITGEGRIDTQSLRGKVVAGVTRRALGIPVIAVVGDIVDPVDEFYREGIAGIFSINRAAKDFSITRLHAHEYLQATMENLMHFISALESHRE